MSTTTFTNSVARDARILRPYALSLTKDVNDADDLMQETTLRALMYEDNFKVGTNLKAWMYTIMKHVFVNEYRRTKKRNTFIKSNTDMQSVNDYNYTVLNDAESNLYIENIDHAFDQMSRDLGSPFKLYFRGFRYREIADSLKLPIGTVKSRIYVAKRELKKHLDRY